MIIDVDPRAKYDLLISCFDSLNESFAGILVDRGRRGEVEGKCGGTERDQVRFECQVLLKAQVN